MVSELPDGYVPATSTEWVASAAAAAKNRACLMGTTGACGGKRSTYIVIGCA